MPARNNLGYKNISKKLWLFNIFFNFTAGKRGLYQQAERWTTLHINY